MGSNLLFLDNIMFSQRPIEIVRLDDFGYMYILLISTYVTPARTLSVSGLKSQVLKLTIFYKKMMVKSGLELFILKFTKPLQSCCCPVQKNLPRKAELAWQVSRYL